MNTITISPLAQNRAEILIFGEIGENLLGKGGSTIDRVKSQLDQLGDVGEIVVRINSPGGNFFDGLGIFNLLRSHRAKVRVEIEGLAASAAAVIAMAGDTITMRQDSFLMIHRASVAAAGTGEDLREAGALLDRLDSQMADIFARRTGIEQERVLELLTAETWFSPSEALDAKFIDAISDDLAAVAVFDFSKFKKVPEAMTQQTKTNEPTRTADEALALELEEKRRKDVRVLFSRFPQYRALYDQCLDDPGCSVEQARSRLLDVFVESSPPPISGTNPHMTSGPLSAAPAVGTDDFVTAASDALLIRAGRRIKEPHPAAQDVAALSLADLAKACLEHSPQARTMFRKEHDPVRAALSTSDFPLILEDAIHKQLRSGFESEPSSHRQWVRVQPVSDFRPQKRPILGSGPDLERVPERVEYKHGYFSEDGSDYAVKKFGRIIDLSWETLKNDNLGVFLQRIPPAMGQSARRLEADTVYALFAENGDAGPVMQDGTMLFDAAHANLASAQAAFDKAALSAGRLLLRKQTAVGGGLLSLVPRYLIVPAELETDAELLIAAATKHRTGIDSNEVEGTASQITSATGATPEWISRLELVVEPRLADGQFFLATSSEQVDTVEMGVLDENEGGPVIIPEEGFNVDRMAWKVRHVFEPKFLDWRGIVRVPLQ